MEIGGKEHQVAILHCAVLNAVYGVGQKGVRSWSPLLSPLGAEAAVW